LSQVDQDEERLQRCDTHYLTPDLRIIPFFSFNVIPEWYRDKIQQKYGLPIEAWEAKNGKKLEDGLYRGTLSRGGHHAGCGCGVGEQGEEVTEVRVWSTSKSIVYILYGGNLYLYPADTGVGCGIR